MNLSELCLSMPLYRDTLTGDICEISLNNQKNEVFKALASKHPEYDMQLGYIGTDQDKWVVVIEIKRIEEPTTGKSYQRVFPVVEGKDEAIDHAAREIDQWLSENILR